MKLSEAIRKGGANHDQIEGYLFRNDAVCALGAAYVGRYGGIPDHKFDVWGDAIDDDKFYDRLKKNFPELVELRIENPACSYGNRWAVDEVIMSLNDDWQWSFEEIADFLETYEL